MTKAAKAGRLATSELGWLDLRRPSDALLWAESAKASSEYSSSYRASDICGPPKVFPSGGDEYNTWLADSSDKDPWVEVVFPKTPEAAALIVCETCGPGAVYEVLDVERDQVLWSGKKRSFRDSRKARLLHIPLNGPAPEKVRLRVAPRDFDSEYKEIDAVALVTRPLAELMDIQEAETAAAAGPFQRFAPGEEGIGSLSSDPRILWAKSAKASSEYSSSYRAESATGKPNVYPRGGDLNDTWLCSGEAAGEWLELRFPDADWMRGVLVFETCGAGAVTSIYGDRKLLWSGAPEKVPRRKARMLHVPLDMEPPKTLRLVLDRANDYREIDAVAILTAPLSDLHAIGEAPERWNSKAAAPERTEFEGTLAADTDFVHAVVRTHAGVMPVTVGGPLRLTLGSGEEVSLEVDKTTLYGPRRFRERGTLEELRSVPWLARCLESTDKAADTEVVVEGRRLQGASAVVVQGEAIHQAQRGGFRDADRAPAALEVSVIATSDKRDALEWHKAENFRGQQKKLEAPAPHPLRRWVRALGAFAAIGVLGMIAAPVLGGLYVRDSLVLAFGVTVYFGVFALEFWAAMNFIPDLLDTPSTGKSDARVPFKPGAGWLVLPTLLFALPLASVAASAGALMLERGWELVLLFPLGGFALIRFFVWARRSARPLSRALGVLFTRDWSAASGSRRRFQGTLAAGAFTRVETYFRKTEHLGTYTSTDDEGNETTHDRYRTWYERLVTGRAPPIVHLELAGGEEVQARARRAIATTHLGMKMRPVTPKKELFARLEAHHDEGDAAILVGTVMAGETMELDGNEPMVLILGSMSQLRRRVVIQLAAGTTLLLFAVGCLLFGGSS